MHASEQCNPLHFSLPVLFITVPSKLPEFLCSLIKKRKSISRCWFFCRPTATTPPPIHFSYAKERMINEFCLYDAAEIHLLVSNLFICLFILISDTLTDFACFHVCAHLDHMKNVLFPLALNAHSSIYLPCRCMSCVASMWGCQWNTIEYTCSDMDDAVDAHIIKNRQVCLFLHPIHTFQYF